MYCINKIKTSTKTGKIKKQTLEHNGDNLIIMKCRRAKRLHGAGTKVRHVARCDRATMHFTNL